MDQTLVRSGFDAEVALGKRYLQYLLLLASDVGLIPVAFDIDDDEHPEKGPIHARLIVPADVDRTYELDPAAEQAESGFANGLDVDILFGDPNLADLKVTARAHLTRANDGLDVSGTFTLFVRLGLQKAPETSKPGLASAGLTIELVHVEGADIAKLKPLVDRTLSLDGFGAGGRVQEIALRKFPSQGTTPAAVNLYINLMLRSGPEPDRFLQPRGDVLQANNILTPDADLVFATRKDIYGAIAADAWYRRAVPSGSGYSYPLHFKHREGTLLNISVAPTTASEGANRLRTKIKAEVEVDNWFDPDITLLVDIFQGVDAEGVMTWNSASEAHDSGLIYHVLLAGVVAAFLPLIGPYVALAIFTGLEIAKFYAEGLISDYYIGDKAEKRLDATLLDVAPNRLTLFRRRWDPFYETQHQVGLRAGDTLITENGIAFWGRAVLTRATKPRHDVVIRDTEHIDDEAPTALDYRVQDIDPFRDLLTTWFPATDRRPFSQHDPVGEPYLFRLATGEAMERVAVQRLQGRIPYLVQRIELNGNAIARLLIISKREWEEQRNLLIDERAAAVSPQIIADHEAEVRAQVLAEFAASGVIPTQEEIDAAVASKLQALIDAEVQTYIDGGLSADVEAALKPLLKLELAPTHLGQLQKEDILEIEDYDLVFVSSRNEYYYRDHYVPAVETTKPKRLADNLHSKPRYRSTPAGPVFL